MPLHQQLPQKPIQKTKVSDSYGCQVIQQNYHKMSERSPSSRMDLRSNQGESLPRKEEWALIYQHKAKQYEILKHLQKQRDREKKNTFKQDLDNQISGKNNLHKHEKDDDRLYYEFITKNAELMKDKEQQDRLDKFRKRRIIQAQNQYALSQHHERSASAVNRPIDNSFDIGYTSERDRKNLQAVGKKTMIDQLDRQLHQKQELKRKQRLQSLQLEQRNNKYLDMQHLNRNKHRKNYGQNSMVYQHYQEITTDRLRRQRQMDHRLVDQAAMKKQEDDYRRVQHDNQKKQLLTNQMQETLEQQVKIHNYKKLEEARVNPEDISYSYMGNMFREKPNVYDKQQYMDYLKGQAQDQKRRKDVANHMSDQEYRLNLNQLNKAVTGNYAHDHYQDRSLTAIGEKEAKENQSLIGTMVDQDGDADIIRNRVDHIRNRRKGYADDRSNVF